MVSITFQEQRLYRRNTGRRRAILLAGVAIANLIGLAWLLIGLGIIPPTPTNKIAICLNVPGLFVPFAALWDNPGENRTWLERFSCFSFIWILIGGVIETGWELSWVILDMAGVVQGANASNHWLWGWWLYGQADSRYLNSDPTVFGIEFAAAILGPLELLAVYLLLKRRYLQGNWLAFLLSWPISFLGVPFLVAEAHVGFRDIQGGWFGFWVIFLGMNIPWLFAPGIAIPAKILELKYWYQREAYLKIRDAGGDVTILGATDGRSHFPDPRHRVPGVVTPVPDPAPDPAPAAGLAARG